MTSEEMDLDLMQAQAILDTIIHTTGQMKTLILDRATHPSVTETSVWFFDGDLQIGSTSREGAYWRTSYLSGGVPTSKRLCPNLMSAVLYVTERHKVRTKSTKTAKWKGQ